MFARSGSLTVYTVAEAADPVRLTGGTSLGYTRSPTSTPAGQGKRTLLWCRGSGESDCSRLVAVPSTLPNQDDFAGQRAAAQSGGAGSVAS